MCKKFFGHSPYIIVKVVIYFHMAYLADIMPYGRNNNGFKSILYLKTGGAFASETNGTGSFLRKDIHQLDPPSVLHKIGIYLIFYYIFNFID